DAGGTLVADSHHDGPPEGREKEPPVFLGGAETETPERAHRPPTPDYHDLKARPEIADALAGRYGAATRISRDGNRVFLFIALPIVRATSGATGAPPV